MTDVRLTRQVALGSALFSLVPGFERTRITRVFQAAADAESHAAYAADLETLEPQP